MKMARNIERRLEGMMEGFFAKVFRSGLQPVEVGRKIAREMDANRTISVAKVFVANDFRIVMGSDDYGRFSQMEAGLVKELSELVIEQAKINRWNLMGMPKISFVEDESIGKGEFRIDSSLTADPDQPALAPVMTREPDRDNPESTGAISLDTANKLGLAQTNAQLLILDDDGTPSEAISITRAPVVVGRLSTNDVVVSDPNVSRRHAEITRNRGRWAIVDLGSTNGTTVNGKVVKEHNLRDGDRLGFGTSEMIFKLTGSS
jgi:pSer/pThr/pTyr-binding forkhead associated (FHA) protein